MNSIRVASFGLVVAFVFAPLPAQAQAKGPGSGLPARMAALEARVAKLESGQVDAADLVGTYALYLLGVELHGGNPAQIGVETSVAIFPLNADGTGSGTVTDGRCDLQQAVPWVLTCGEEAGSGTFTWTVENGTLVIPGDENLVATIGAGGRAFIFGGTAPGAGFSNLGIAIRLPNQ